MTSLTKAQLVKSLARELGCDLVGIAPADPPPGGRYYRAWLEAGHHANMRYLSRSVETRLDPRKLLPNAHSVVCIALSYNPTESTKLANHNPASPQGLIARYARGTDYHHTLHTILNELLARLRDQLTDPFDARICVDTAPLLERELAVAAGLGWIGRNTCLLNQHLGSYLLLGNLITTLDLPPDEPVTPRCGSCTRCLDSCPTQAFVGPHQLNASRCISYLTIENRDEIPAEFHAPIGPRVFGCDRCQEVCPYNRRAPVGTHPALLTERVPAWVDLLPLLNLRAGQWRRWTAHSALARARQAQWRRNAAIVLGNHPSMDEAVQAALRTATTDPAKPVAHAASAALARRRKRSQNDE